MFEKYQNFIAIIIAGALIAGGILLSKNQTSNIQQENYETEEQVTKTMVSLARKIGLNQRDYEACLRSGEFVPALEDAIALAEQSGVQGTPTFIVIKRTFNSDGTIVSEQQIPVVGARDIATFEQVIATGQAPADQGPFSGEKIILNETDHWKGPKNAEVVIVKYTDIDCPFCKRSWTTLDPLLEKNSNYALVYRHSPILSLHPLAGYKAIGSECAKKIGGEEVFWKFIDGIAR